MGELIKAILREMRINVDRDKAEVQRAMQSLVHMTARTISSMNGTAEHQDHQNFTTHERDVANGGLPVNTTDPICAASTARMLTHGHRSAYRDERNPSQRRAVVTDMPAPKYGLPGIGEDEERRKQFQKEWKQECQKQMSENASQPRRRMKNVDVTAVDYEEILARKRSEEHKYRHQNGDPTFVSASLRPFLSEGNLNTNRSTNGYGHDSRVKFPPEIKQADVVRYNNLSEEDYDRFDGNFRDYVANRVTSTRPHSYPTEYNGVLSSPPDVSNLNGRPRAYDDGFSPGDYRRQLDDQMRDIVERRQRELYEHEVENYYRNNVAQPTVDQNYESSRRHLRSDDGVFVTLDRTEKAQMARKHMDQPITVASNYQADLALQMEETKQRKRDEKAEDMRHDMRIEEENKQYNPWGRGGGGAPVKDREGKSITVRGQLGNDRARKVSIVAPTVEAGYLQRNLPDDIPLGAANARIAPPSYAPVQQTVPRLGRAMVPAATTLETYQEDLRRQIEDKRRRELEEKERDRLEEEKMMRRVEEENEKMKQEFEEELKKQKQREEERLRRNEELLQRQQEQKKETERLKRDQREKERLEQWESRERTVGRDFSLNGGGGRSSPPIRGANKTNARKMSVAADNAKLLVASAVPQKQPNRQLQQPLPEPKRSDAEPHEESREHILSQLSAMRQQLEREQKVMQTQLKKEMGDDDYVVLNKKPAASSRNPTTSQRRRERPSPISYRPITNPNVAIIATERRPSTEQPAIKSHSTLNMAMATNKNSFHRDEDEDRGCHDDDVVEQYVPPSHKSHVLWPNNTALSRGAAGHAQKTLKGDSFFLAGVESDDVGNHDGYGRWKQEEINSQTWRVDDDLQADSSSDISLVRRTDSKQDESSDDIQDDSFLDEFMGRNLHRR